MEGIRIVALPECKMISSGISTEPDPFAEDSQIMRFNKWWSELDKSRKDKFFPRDFMWYDRKTCGIAWWYAVFDVPPDTGGYAVVDFGGGLYAAAISKDDDPDGERVYEGIRHWVRDSGCFELDERPGHYDMYHITTPDEAYKAMGYRQLDIYVPIRIRQPD